MGKNVAVFVDVANIFYAAKAAGVDIDYVTLLRSVTAGRDLVRAYAYTGLDPDNENQRNFHSFLARSGYKVVSKDIRKYGDGKIKANLDIELVVDMMKTARNLDIAIVVSGDGDFKPAIRAVQEMGVRCEVVSFRGNTSSDLMEVADLFTDITQLAKVEKGSRSGRRVAEDDQDLSMTEVPDKQTEGTGRGRGRGRGRDRAGDREPVAASGAARGRGRRPAAAAPSTNGSAGIVALPGERLSRTVIGDLTEADLARAEVFTLDDEGGEPLVAATAEDAPAGPAVGDDEDGTGEEGQRRRRRRGGRGRGRGRGRGEGESGTEGAESFVAESDAQPQDAEEPAGEAAEVRPAATARPPRSVRAARPVDEDIADEPRRPRTGTPFGSVWDSQLGTSTPAPSSLAPLPDEEWEDEPEIPEYLIAERNRGARGARGGRGGGARGGRAAYQSAIERERFGRGGGGGGINRYPDVSERTGERSGGRSAAPAPRRDDRGPRPERAPAGGQPRAGGEWSEVPPELEELLRAQLGQKSASPTSPGGRSTPPPQPDVAETPAEAVESAAETPAPRRRSTTRRSAASVSDATEAGTPDAVETAPAARRRTTRRSTPTTDAPAVSADATEGDPGQAADAAPAKRTRRTTRSTAAAEDSVAPGAETSAEPAKPRRRTTRAAATAEASEAPAGSDDAAAAPAAPRRRTTRKTATTEPA